MMVSLRALTEADLPYLLEIYAGTRAEELALVPEWSDEDKKRFITQQFMAQHQYYREFYQGAELQMIVRDERPIGRLYIHWNYSPKEVRIMDIALLPGHRGKGIGSQLLSAVLQKGSALGKTVTIHVEFNNPALHLYERLGFRKIGEFNSVYYLYEWKPFVTA
ncbi:MAG: GNAT family N-acetyltransferase [Spirosomataceae bacterium]